MINDRRPAAGDSDYLGAGELLADVGCMTPDGEYCPGCLGLTCPGCGRCVARCPGGCAYTHPDVLTTGVRQGWAEPETNPARVDWPARQAAAAIPFDVAAGRPVNPGETTAVRYGRGELGFWGENLMADALVTATCQGQRYLLMVERGDGRGWALPGGAAEPGESGTAAAVRELAEETGLRALPLACQPGDPVYVPDPRASDEAWAVTIPVRVDLGPVTGLPYVTGRDDAARADWIRAGSYDELAASLARRYRGHVFTAHAALLSRFLA